MRISIDYQISRRLKELKSEKSAKNILTSHWMQLYVKSYAHDQMRMYFFARPSIADLRISFSSSCIAMVSNGSMTSFNKSRNSFGGIS
ncbi:MAG TPA: hypothetical protein VH500_10510 [Nitrososphaeraceae archaeon]